MKTQFPELFEDDAGPPSAASAGSAFRILSLDDVIQIGDEWRALRDWFPVETSVGRTVRDQYNREWNDVMEFRRTIPPNTKISDGPHS